MERLRKDPPFGDLVWDVFSVGIILDPVYQNALQFPMKQM